MSQHIMEQIGKLLADDPICGGRVASGTIEAIAALVSRPSGDDVERLRPWLRHTLDCQAQQDLHNDTECRCGLDAALCAHARQGGE